VYDHLVYPLWKEHEEKIEKVSQQIEKGMQKVIKKYD
jgi:hypothetical protein